MPFCPSCGEEFRPGVARCADCGVELVPERPGPGTAGGEGPRNAACFGAAATEPIAERLEQACRRLNLPCARVAGGEVEGILLPAEVAGRAVAFLAAQMRDLVLEPPAAEGEPFCFRPYDPERDQEVRGSDLLHRPEAELAGAPAALEGLVAVVARGDAATRFRAVRKLLGAGEQGLGRVRALLAEVCLRRDEECLVQCLEGCAGVELPGLEASLDPLLGHEDPDVVILALRVAWRLRLEGLGRRAADLLLHANPLGREEADEFLVELSGEDLGFEADLPDAERERLRSERLAWLRKRRS